MRSSAVGALVYVLVLPAAASAAGPEIFLRDEPGRRSS